jgi:DNA-binding transcriptional MocR family regulator
MTIWIPDLSRRSGSFALALADAIAEDIAGGRLRPGEQLPPQRDLAHQLGVSVGTVTRSYSEARRRGLVAGRVGSGTYVRDHKPAETGFGIRDRSMPQEIDLAVNLIHCTLWPAAFHAALADLSATSETATLLEYVPAQGSLRHRRTAADWIERPGFAPEPDRIALCHGAQNGVAAVLSALTRPGDTVICEEATYPPVKVLAEMYGLKLEGVALDSEGIVPEALDAVARTTAARVLYLTPTLQNPTGAMMSDGRRREIAAIARRYDIKIVEDDVVARLADPPATPIAAYAPERTWYVTSVSKSLAPGLRIGYVAAPDSEIEPVLTRIRALGWMASSLSAEIVEIWMQNGTADDLVRYHRRENRVRLDMARAQLGEFADAGLASPHIWFSLPSPWRTGEFVSRLAAKGVGVAPSEAFAVSRMTATPAVRISLSAAPDRVLLRSALTTISETLADDPMGESAIF